METIGLMLAALAFGGFLALLPALSEVAEGFARRVRPGRAVVPIRGYDPAKDRSHEETAPGEAYPGGGAWLAGATEGIGPRPGWSESVDAGEVGGDEGDRR